MDSCSRAICSEILQKWASQSSRDKAPLGCAAMCLVSSSLSPDMSCIPVHGFRQQRCSIYIFLEGCLTCFHSDWLVCLVWQDTVALFYPSCPGTLGKPCGAVRCLGEMLSTGAAMQLLLKLTDLMAKLIPQYQFEMKGKVPGCCEGQWTLCKGRVCPWYHYVGGSWWK